MKKIYFTLLLALLFQAKSFAQFNCGDSLIDSGGSSGQYQNSEDDTIYLCPTVPGEAVQLTFGTFATELNYDFLYIYNSNTVGTNLIGTYSGTQNLGVIIAENPSGCLTLVWHSDGSVQGDGYSAMIDCVPAPTCLRPSNLAVTNITSNAGTFSWTSNDSETRWVLEYGPSGFTPGTGSSVVSLTNPRTVSTFAPLTTYDMYIRARCGIGDTSAYFGPITFTTNPAPLACGDTFTDSGNDTSNYQVNEDYTFVACPSLPGETVQVTFSVFSIENGYDFMTIYDANNSFTNQIGQYTGDNSPGVVVAENASGCLTFHFTSDDIIPDTGWVASVTCIPALTCLKPTAVSTSNATDNSIDVSWTASNGESNWVIQYGPAGFTPGTGMTVNANSNPFTVTGLNPTTAYDFYVKAACGSNDSSAYSIPTSGTTTNAPLVCGNQFTDSGGAGATYSPNENQTYNICPTTPGQVVLLNFTVFNMESGYDSMFVYNGNSTADVQIAALSGQTNPGQIYSTNPNGCLTVVFTSDGSVQYDGWLADITCVDPITCPEPANLTVATNGNEATLSWNTMGTETAWMIEYDTTGFTLGNGTMVAASTNPFNITGLDYSTNYDFYVYAVCSSTDTSIAEGPVTATTGLAPFTCGNMFYDNGGLGAYANGSNDTITICPSPGYETVEIIFTSFETEQNFDSLMIFNGPDVNSPLIGTYQGTDTIDTLNGTCFTFVFVSDGSVSLAGWEAMINCYGVCPPPSNLTATNITNVQAQVSWTSNGTETQWQIEYGPTGFAIGTGTVVNPATNPATITGLTINTTYDFYVKALCSSQDTSIYSAVGTFTTTNNVSVPEIKNEFVSVYPNPSSDVFNITNISGKDLTYNMTDVRGRLVTTNSTTLTANETNSISVVNLERGMYFITISNGNEHYTIPVIKN